MTKLDQSVASVLASLRGTPDVRKLVALTTARRRMDLSDLSPAGQAALVAERAHMVEPSAEALATRLAARRRQLVIKFTVEPFGTRFHLGNAVPLLVLDRLRRMGHRVVFVVGTVTAKTGDASGAIVGRPPPTGTEIARNLAAYRKQVASFIDIDAIEWRSNEEWLTGVQLPRLLELAAYVRAAPLVHDNTTTVAWLLYTVAKAVDSLEVGADVEVGGTYQSANMAACREIMAGVGAEPEIAVSTPLIHGVDGLSSMSASRHNDVPLTASASEVFSGLCSIPDELVRPYLCALTEWRDIEIDAAGRSLTTKRLRAVLAADVTAGLHGIVPALHELDTSDYELTGGTGR